MAAIRYVRVGVTLALAALAAVTVAGCAQPTTSQQPTTQDPALLTAHNWAVKTYLDANGKMTAPIESRQDVGITFEAKRARGFAGVNTFNGGYVADAKGTIKIGPLATTMIAGPEPLMTMEGAYLKALDAAATYRVTATSLELLDSEGTTVATFGEGAPEPELEGTQWFCTGYNNGREAFVSLVLDTQITAQFDGGKLTGSSGVNNYSGTYTLKGQALSIEAPFATTKKAGPADAMDQESAYLQALSQVERYGIEGGVLTLYGSGDLRLITYADKLPE